MCKVPSSRPRAAPIVVGFSVRGLAEATAAAVRPPLAVDCFADHDCRQAAEQVVRLNQWGGNVLNSFEFLRELVKVGATPQSQVLLAGGMENWLELTDLLHLHFTVLGPTVDQLRRLRSPECWQRWARQSSIAFPETLLPQSQWQPDQPAGNWLVKPLRGAGGSSIRRSSSFQSRSVGCSSPSWSEAMPPSNASPSTSPDSSDTYLQRQVAGRSLGVYCVLHRDGSAQLLGATESISAAQWPGPSEFIYRGSLGPIDLPQHHCRQVVELCQLIQRETGSLGWLQLDFIEDQAGELWLLELNPRWAAGMEILFLAGINSVQHHCRAWRSEAGPDGTLLASPTSAGPAVEVVGGDVGFSFGKAIVYAPRELELTHRCIESLHSLPRDNFADLPSHHLIAAGQAALVVSCGEPLLTVRADGPRDTLLEQLAGLRETALAALAGVIVRAKFFE